MTEPPGARTAPNGLPPIERLMRIGGGRSADIYALPDGRVLKLFRPGADRTIARREVAAIRLAARTGISAPDADRPVSHAGRAGFCMARIEGETALAAMRSAPHRMFAKVGRLARYHAEIHRVRARPGALPDTHFVLAARVEWSSASAKVKAAALARLDALPQGDRLCHGDLHPDNLILGTNGPVAIDWSQATRGDPAADVARTALLLCYAAYGRRLRRYAPLRAIRHLLAWWYVRCYRRATVMTTIAIDAWRVPVAVAWLHEGSEAFAPSLNRMLARAVRRG